jgi:hypothetical protein
LKEKHELFFGGCYTWLCQGKIKINVVQDELSFCARWVVSKSEESEVICTQEIEVEGMEDKIENKLHITNIKDGKFDIVVQNDIWGEATGTGRIYPEKIAWEVRKHGPGFEGLEIYSLAEDGKYTIRSDFMTPNEYRSHIEGAIWKKSDAIT